MKRFIITEEEKNRILGLYEQVSTSQTTNNIFTQNGYKLITPNNEVKKKLERSYQMDDTYSYQKGEITLMTDMQKFYFVVAPQGVKHLGPYDIKLDNSIYRDILKMKK